MFEVGDKVMLVADDWTFQVPEIVNRPVKDVVYVIRDIFQWYGKEGLLLVGIVNGAALGQEAGFAPWRFRKLADVQAENKAKRQAKKGVSGRAGAKGFSHQEP